MIISPLWFIIVGPAILLGIWAQYRVQHTYNKYSRVGSRSRITGREAAEAVMRAAGISDVEIAETQGTLTDHYDPSKKRLVLSSANYRGTSLAALGVAAHEAGHAIQHKVGYSMLKLRMSLVGITGFASQTLNVLIMVAFFSLFLGGMGLGAGLIKVIIALMAIITFFQLVTLPVEFDASRRANEQLASLGIIQQDEKPGVAATLNAAGWTYVAAFIASLAQMLYWVMLLLGRRD